MQTPFPYSADDLLSRAYQLGVNHGHGFACHNVPRIGDRISPCVDYVGLGRHVTGENIREYHELLCHAAESNSRQYSPFEFIAHEFNGQEEFADDLWEAFDAGTAAAIGEDIQGYTNEDYGIESKETEEIDE